MIEIIKNEWKGFLRNRMFLYVGVTFTIVLLITCWVSNKQVQLQHDLQQTAQLHIRSQWDDMGATNPHNAVHFGTYAFKPYQLMNSIDEGVNAVTGNVLRLEGHVQNEMEFSEASQSLMISVFGKLTPALLLQYVIPLFLIFLSFSAISLERESGRIKLLVIQGLSLPKMIFYKSISLLIIGMGMLFIGLFLQMLTLDLFQNSDTFLRLFSLFLAYLFFYYILILLTVILSAWLKTPTAALSSILAIWVIWVVFLPKIFGLLTEDQYPLPSRQAFKLAMKVDRENGINGHAPSSNRKNEFKQKILKEYEVDSVEELPINLDGLLMQADEEYGNKVWDKHFGSNYQILKDQKWMYQLLGIIDPFIALQNLSMGFSGSDLFHHQDFLLAAENYRRDFIKSLNDKHAYGGSKSGDWSWKASEEFYKSINDFNYQIPPLLHFINYYLIDVLITFFWMCILILIVQQLSNKIEVI
ncbi:MAG: hypothetical protein CMO01_30770 [Thalassobius sp.]|nr:hypothetical protein [Thalassovita sp.]